MNPDQRIAQLEAQVAEMRELLNKFRSFNTIPLEVDKAFSTRLLGDTQPKITDITADFPADPLSQSVSEGGTASYKVAAPPDYALRVRLGGLSVAIGAYDY